MPCYVNYTDRNCPICMPRENNECGFCVSIQQCDVGDDNGPFNVQCVQGLWIRKKDKCSNDMCALAKEQQYCFAPCIWRYGSCILPRDINIVSEGEKYNHQSFRTTQQFLFYSFVAFLFFAIVFCIISRWYNKRPIYRSLPNLQGGISLDDLPAPLNDNYQD